MEHIRRLSRALEPSPVRRTGLKNALLDLAESFPGVSVRYTTAVAVPSVDADAIYRAIANSVAAASRAPGVTRITISVSGSRSLVARVEHNGRQRGADRELAATALLARHAGLGFEIKARQSKTRQGTIVVIQYAGRRPTGG
jgi:signal transduction histidine kinase